MFSWSKTKKRTIKLEDKIRNSAKRIRETKKNGHRLQVCINIETKTTFESMIFCSLYIYIPEWCFPLRMQILKKRNFILFLFQIFDTIESHKILRKEMITWTITFDYSSICLFFGIDKMVWRGVIGISKHYS